MAAHEAARDLGGSFDSRLVPRISVTTMPGGEDSLAAGPATEAASSAGRITRLLADRRSRLVGHPLTFTSHYAPERAVYFAEAFAEHAADALPIRWARATADALARVAIEILPDELIVGEPGADGAAAANLPAERSRAANAALAQYYLPLIQSLPSHQLAELATDIGLARGWHGRSGHNVVDYAEALRLGLGGLRSQAAAGLAALPAESAADQHADAPARRQFYVSAIISLDGVAHFIRRHAVLASELADSARESSAAQADLRAIAATCERLATEPPTTLREALQLVWFLHLATKIEDGGVGHSFGRLDQYLYPYYEADRARGVSREALVDLLTVFWIKLGSECEEASHLTLGGQTPTGEDATNDLSFACLEADRRVSTTAPNLSARVHAQTPAAFWRAIAQTMAGASTPALVGASTSTFRQGAGHPAVFNDEVTIPGLQALGVPVELARDYSKVGCVETFFAGRSTPWIDCYISLPKCLELTLTGGRCLVTGRVAGPAGPIAASFATFEELFAAFAARVQSVTALVLESKAAYDMRLAEYQAAPLQSALTPCALARGRDVYAGGAEYNLTGAYLVGLATVVDSLAAIRQIVFEERVISLAELVEVLRVDFVGHEALRLRLRSQPPKYGNDDDSVDELAKRVVALFSRSVLDPPLPKSPGTLWLRFPMIGSVWGHIQMGAATGATADGRHRGESLSDGGSPALGSARLGATAALRSVAKPDHRAIPGGEAVNLSLSPGPLAGEPGLANLVALLRGYFGLGGEQIQVNVVGRATLEAARQTPAEYRHLVVRVAGFCAFFTCLDDETQRQIIERSEHTLAG